MRGVGEQGHRRRMAGGAWAIWGPRWARLVSGRRQRGTPGGVTDALPMYTPGDPLLSPAEVAALFRVTSKTVTRWAKSGQLPFITTLGGHRRYPEAEVRALLDQDGEG